MQFDFEPKYFILDKGKLRTLVVKSEDKYAVKGEYIEMKESKWSRYPAYLNKQNLIEFQPRYELTKNESEAIMYAAFADVFGEIPLSEEECNIKFQTNEYCY